MEEVGEVLKLKEEEEEEGAALLLTAEGPWRGERPRGLYLNQLRLQL